MTEGCQNIVTPKMIKTGQVEIGDKIQLENDAVLVQGPAQMQNSNRQSNAHYDIEGIPGGVIKSPKNDFSSSSQRRTLNYEQMTPYMSNTGLGGSMENPSIILPQSPLSPNGYQEEIDNAALQSFNGFLRTQIGRYMRVEQLVTSDRTEDRLGFLVGVGTNFIILQDITTGNILVIDIFSIRLTYVYYSPAVVPEF